MPRLSGPEDAPRDPLQGTCVSRFEIVREIGRGGMGVVYLARDQDLGRLVALKRPWPELVDNEIVQRRFRREARTAARLLHPGIVPVIEVFVWEGADWLVFEFVEGENLESRIQARGPLPVDEILSHGVDLAEALKFAHEKGVLHRDIKPRNVLIDVHGRARLTDFGLASFLPAADGTSLDSTRATSLTTEGHVVGTPLYMSPEQALGRPVDARCDLYALGAVLYEMCAARSVVEPGPQGEVLDAILHREPAPISRFNYAVPTELERIVRKCLAKRPDERYQQAGELLADLRAMRRRSESQPIVAPVPRRRGLLIAAGAAVAAAAGLALWQAARDPSSVPAPGRARQVTVGPGWEAEADISPDGEFVAYTSDAAGNPDIWIMDVRGGNALRLTDDPASDRSPRFTPDGRALLFASDRGGGVGVWKVPRLGGAATLVVPRADEPAPSPDGTRVAFVRPDAGGASRIAVASFDAPDDAKTITGPKDGFLNHQRPAWSPDGREICYSDTRDLWIVSADGGPARPLTRDSFANDEPAWSPSGNHIYFASRRDGVMALWRIDREGGRPQRVTLGTGPERRPSLTRDGRSLAYTTSVEDPDLQVADLVSGRRFALSAMGVEFEPAVAPDGGEVVFVSTRWGETSLWSQRLGAEGPEGPPQRLTEMTGGVSNPHVSPDGRWIAFQRRFGERREIWVISIRGGEPQRVSDGTATDMQPAWSPDGSSLAFVSDRSGRLNVWVLPVVQGRPTGPVRRVTSGLTTDQRPTWSPDGSRIAFVGSQEDTSEIFVVPATGGAAHKVTDNAVAEFVRWDARTDTLLVSGLWGEARITLRRVRPVGGPSQPLDPPVDFGPAARFGDFDLSSDGRVLVTTRDELRGDVWVLEAAGRAY